MLDKIEYEDFLNLLDNASLGIHFVAADGTILWANKAELELLGYSKEEYIGKHIANFHADEEVICDILNQLANNQVLKNYEARLTCKDGSVKIVQINSNVYFKEGKFTHTRCFTRDITELKKVQQARLQEVENYKQKQTEFIGHLCHEVRNPLSGITGYLELLSEKIKTLQLLSKSAMVSMPQFINDINTHLEEIKTILIDMNICAEHQKAILDNNLDTTMVESDKLKLDESPFDPKEVIYAVVKIAKARAMQKKLNINISLPEMDLLIKGDAYRFKQVILNLLMNAVKFTEKGQITVELMVLEQTEKNSRLQIRIKDTGIGIASEDMNKLFQRFSQANLSVGGQYGGSGLGLFITKHLINLMGGDIYVKSVLGKGSTFQFNIVAENVRLQADKRKAFDSLEETILTIIQKKSHTILIVDDNIINQKMLKSVLDRAGQLSVIASDGKEALAKFSDPNNHFDLIFMDIVMPKMDGLAATQAIRCLEQERQLLKIPIVALSGNAQQQDKEAAFSAGMDDYLTKPFKSEQIYEKIMRLCHPSFLVGYQQEQPAAPIKIAKFG